MVLNNPTDHFKGGKKKKPLVYFLWNNKQSLFTAPQSQEQVPNDWPDLGSPASPNPLQSSLDKNYKLQALSPSIIQKK